MNFILDPRTGLARFHDFAVSNDQFMSDMMIFCRHHPVDEILALPDMEERKYLYLEARGVLGTAASKGVPP